MSQERSCTKDEIQMVHDEFTCFCFAPSLYKLTCTPYCWCHQNNIPTGSPVNKWGGCPNTLKTKKKCFSTLTNHPFTRGRSDADLEHSIGMITQDSTVRVYQKYSKKDDGQLGRRHIQCMLSWLSIQISRYASIHTHTHAHTHTPRNSEIWEVRTWTRDRQKYLITL